VGQVFQTQVEAAQRRGTVTAAVIGSDFEGWWEAEGDTTLFRALANNDGDIMKCGRMIARMAWLRGALTAAELDRGASVSDPYGTPEIPSERIVGAPCDNPFCACTSSSEAAAIAYADAEAKRQAERGEVVP
jgi:hypothetical protein